MNRRGSERTETRGEYDFSRAHGVAGRAKTFGQCLCAGRCSPEVSPKPEAELLKFPEMIRRPTSSRSCVLTWYLLERMFAGRGVGFWVQGVLSVFCLGFWGWELRASGSGLAHDGFKP